MTKDQARAAAFGASPPLLGTVRVPGDKSISHRALLIAAMATGRSRIEGLSDGADVRSTAAALRALGVRIEWAGDSWAVDGVGTGGLRQPAAALDLGNSGTSARLLMGLIASHGLVAAFTGDESLSSRPMNRVIAPLRRMGAEIAASPGGRLPLLVRGLCPAVPLTHVMAVPSAQVKSALLLAGLNIPGTTRIVEPVATRDHSERMLRAFGADIRVDGEEIALTGEADLAARTVVVPGDASAAAFLAVAALIVPGSDLRIEGVGLNPGRTGLFDILREMSADLAFDNIREEAGEPVGDLRIRHSPLRAVEVPPEAVPAMIDEFPIFFIAAAFAEGTSRASGLAELRVKESDRLAVMARGLDAIGVEAQESRDGLAIVGSGGSPRAGGARIDPRLDHRIAMSFAVAGLHCAAPVEVADMAPADTSFPGFEALITGLAQ